MKKIICLTMLAALLICTAIGMPSSASSELTPESTISLVPDSDPEAPEQSDNPYAEQSEITFNPDESAASARELGIMRLREAGCSDFTISCFSDEELEMLASATKALVFTSYFTEVYDEESDEASLVAVSYEDFAQFEQEDANEEEEIPVLIPEE